MWVLYAFGSALFAGLTAVLAKCGIRKTDSTVATAIRTIVVLVFSWLMVFLVGSQSQITQLGGKTLLFLILSGLATGASCPAVESAINALAPTCSVHQLEVATIPMPIAPTRYTYHGAPENRSGCRLTSR